MRLNLGDVGFIHGPGALTGCIGAMFKVAVENFGVHPCYEQGVSVGAYNAAAHPRYLGEMWKDVEKKGPSFLFNWFSWETLWNTATFKPFIFSSAGIQELVDRIDFEALIRSPRRVEAAVFNERSWKREFVSNHDEEAQKNPAILKRAWLAAVSPDGLFRSVPIRENSDVLYFDAQTFSIRRALDLGCKKVFVFRNEPIISPPTRQGNWFFRLAARSWLGRAIANRDAVSETAMDEEIERYREHVIEFRLERYADTLWPLGCKHGDITQTMDLAYARSVEILRKL